MNNQQQQIELMKIARQKDEQIAERYSQVLNTETFPTGRLSPEWHRYTRSAIMKSAPMSHRLPLHDFAAVVGIDPDRSDITLFQFGVLSNSLEAVSPEQLGTSAETYTGLIKEAVSHIEWYADITKKLRDKLTIEVETEFQMKSAATNGLKVAEA